MPSTFCLTCGKLTANPTRCNSCEAARKALYGPAHQKARAAALQIRPVCNQCGHIASVKGNCGVPQCKKCPLQFDHLEPVRGGRLEGDSRRQLLCRICNRAKG